MRKGLTLLAAFAATLMLVAAMAFAQTPRAGTPEFKPDLSMVFTFFFVMLGPLKILGPFAAMTRKMEESAKNHLALMGALLSAAALVVAATLGVKILEKWNVSHGALLLAAGIILFLVALEAILKQGRTGAPDAKDHTDSPPDPKSLLFSPLTFPTIVTPYGVATVVLVASMFPDMRMAALGVGLGIMVLNFLAMVFASKILKTPGVAPALMLIGSVLGVLQVALGVQMMVTGLRLLGIISRTS
jgi:multiple antibiotic resistance protein